MDIFKMQKILGGLGLISLITIFIPNGLFALILIPLTFIIFLSYTFYQLYKLQKTKTPAEVEGVIKQWWK